MNAVSAFVDDDRAARETGCSFCYSPFLIRGVYATVNRRIRLAAIRHALI